MYLVTDKTKHLLPEIYPSFLITDLLRQGKTDRNVSIKPIKDGYEIKTPKIWIEVRPIEFVAPR